jgi:hypothetical protein
LHRATSAANVVTAQLVASASRCAVLRYASTNAANGRSGTFATAATARAPSLSARSIASGHQFVARGEVPIKASVGQPGILRQIGDADTSDAVLAEARGGYLHDAIMALGSVSLPMAHPDP